jgi:3-oxoacyl-[acyl-carrier protein] reductase
MSMSDTPVALITNAHTYVGAPLARVLACSGHRFVLHVPRAGRDTALQSDDGVDRLASELGSLGCESVVVRNHDLSTAEGNSACVDAALSRFGRLDAACLVTGTIAVGSFLKVNPDTWDTMKRFNLDMVFHGLQAVLPPMLAAGRGQVVVFTSATGARPEPRTSVYAATRAGANALVRAVGLEHAASGVTVNAIGTNFMDFPGFRDASGMDDPERAAKVLAQVPMHRLGSLDELAEFTAVLLDGRSRFQTGQFFSYSGGWSS